MEISGAKALIESLKKEGVEVIFGYPGEEKADFQETLDYIKANKKLIPKTLFAGKKYKNLPETLKL